MPQVLRPESINQALSLLEEGGEDTKVIAGGTAMMLMMRAGLIQPAQLVALDRVAELEYVTVEEETVRLGALTCLRSLERSKALRESLPTLAAAIALVANHRVRQQATIGGNVSEADYASDPPAVLASLGCRVRIASAQGERIVELREFLVSYYETVLKPNELVVEVVIPRPPATARTTYIKYLSRSAEDRPCVGVAAYLVLDGSGRCQDLRVVVGAATATPFIMSDVTDACRGVKPEAAVWASVAEAYGDAIEPIGDARGSSAYRKQITGELVRRALETVSAAGSNGASRL